MVLVGVRDDGSCASLASMPGAYIQFLRIDGTGITDPIRDRKQLTGLLDDVMRRLDELLEL